MGLCCSKKKTLPPEATSEKVKKTVQQSKKAAKAEALQQQNQTKRAPKVEVAAKQQPAAVVVPSAPVRTSSCTKEEVDAILIQCGRLSRSSSGNAASSETGGGGHRRRRSGSKRSYDLDQERRAAGGADEECDWERQGVAAASRTSPSPHRGSPQRKRSGSRERSGGGSRRASRSPGRRVEGGAASSAAAISGGGDRVRQQQPAKMVSVPAREKGRAPSPVATSGKRCASPRSSSPARMMAGNENAGAGPTAGYTPSLSRSSSPYRRSPMAELDENSLLRTTNTNNVKPQKKSTAVAVAGKEQAAATSCRSGKEKTEITENTIVAASETKAHTSRTTTTSHTVTVAAESLSQRPAGQPACRSRRASRDFDQNPGSYATQLLEDIQNYHQQTASAAASATAGTPSVSLPACVAKARSILEAVADLNSASSENHSYEHEPGCSADDKGSVNAPLALGAGDRVHPSARKHASVREIRAETEPQESAGSNSISGHQWTPSWEPTSVESTDRSTGDEVVEEAGSYGAPSPNNRPRQSKKRSSQAEPSSRSRGGSGNGNSLQRGRSALRGSCSVASARSGARAVSATS